MSVLIKGMKMPQSCYMCDMQELSGVVGCKHAYDTNNSEWGRALNCPLIELPDHGDLISRRAALNELPYANWGKEWDEALAKAIIESLPTIDPAENGGCWVCKCALCRSEMEGVKNEQQK